MTVKIDHVASLVHSEFDRLPAKRKPVVRDNGLREWVPLSGIVAEDPNGKLTCLSLATGMKCLPASKLPYVHGNVLHDWHAEVLAIRAFNCFVLDECRALANGGPESSSKFIRRRSSTEMNITPESVEDRHGCVDWHGQPFAWREDVLLYMYCSEAPCGDASMELTIASQADATPWTIPQALHEHPEASSSLSPTTLTGALPDPDALLPGRAYFSQLGIVRRKPSRGDAPPTLSKSCSDKLSLRQCTSLLSSPTSLLVSPENVYINTLILPRSQFSASGCQRAFSDGRRHPDEEGDEGKANSRQQRQQARMAPLTATPGQNHRDQQAGGYAFRPFRVETTDLEFAFSRRSADTPLPSSAALPHSPPFSSSSSSSSSSSPASPKPTPTKTRITPSNLSVALTASGREETTLNGVLQGRKASDADVRGASFASRRRTWGMAVEVAGLLSGDDDDDDDSSHGDNNNKMTSNVRRIRRALGAVRASASTCSTKTTTMMTETTETTYGDVKSTPLLEPRRRAKEAARRLALRGWVRNMGDEDFAI